MTLKRITKAFAIIVACMMLVACTNNTQLDDYAVNTKSDVSSSKSKDDTSSSKGISKDKIKVGVLHLSDPEEGSGYTYTLI